MCNNYTYRGNHMIYIIIALTLRCCIRVDIPENKRDTQVHNLKDLKGSLRHAKKNWKKHLPEHEFWPCNTYWKAFRSSETQKHCANISVHLHTKGSEKAEGDFNIIQKIYIYPYYPILY